MTNVRGCRQVVDDGVTGRLVPVRDARALADAVADIGGAHGLRVTTPGDPAGLLDTVVSGVTAFFLGS